MKDIRNLALPDLPPRREQERIADILSAYDDLIENNARRIAILEELAQALYREWFIDFRFSGHEQGAMVESEIGLIPQGWEPRRLGDVAHELRRGVHPDEVDPETPYVGLEHIPRRSIALTEWGAAKDVQSTKLAFKRDEILFGKIRPYLHKVGLAPIDGICSSDTIVLDAVDPAYHSLVLCCVSSAAFVAHAAATSQGTQMPRASWEAMAGYPLAVPPAPLLNRFDEFVAAAVAQIHNLILRNRNLCRTRDLLLPRLVTGEIDISEAPARSVENAA
jgi:type I restriction enzyme S subunit